jgi:hypothetical protein
VTERRPTNSELRLQQLEEQELQEREDRGILELFDEPSDWADEPLERDAER